MTFEQTTGTRAQVWHGTAKHTSGGLTKSDLMMNKHGRIVSRKKHNTAKKEKRLVKAGFLTKKGHFGFIKKGSKSRKMRGGDDVPDLTFEEPNSTEPNNGELYSAETGGRKRKTRGGKRHRKMRGGMYQLSPSTYDGKGVGTSGANLQFVAGNAA